MALNNRFFQSRRDISPASKYKKNEEIVSPTLRVITDDGEQLGVITLQEALRRAQDDGLDLIEVASKADPPVARIASWSKFKFEMLKKEKQAKKKNKSKELKEMWFQPMIGKGDLDHKVKRVKEFLEEKHSVKLVVKMYGRVSTDIGMQLMHEVIAQLSDVSVVDTEPKRESKQILAIIRPGKK